MSEPIKDDVEALKVAHCIIRGKHEMLIGYFSGVSAGYNEAYETLQDQIPRLNAYLAYHGWGELV